MAPKRQLHIGPRGYTTGETGPHSYQQSPVGQQARDEKTTGHKARPRWASDQLPGHDHGGPARVPGGDCYPASDHSDGKPAHHFSGGKPLHDLSDR
jgi:hypothetical protein